MPVGMETDIQIKASNGQVSVDKAQGIVECFVAGIGNKDSVGDIIQPGAFAGTLQRRKPRVVWGHNWNDPIGKVLDIQEVGPSDPRLPEKMKAGGVGGLYARVQFNLGSEKGREAFANVAFFGGEQEWSIGYKTINATFDPVRQANILHEVELYECSPVLHGANQLTGTISVKGAEAALMERPITETHDLEFAFDDLDEKDGMLAMMPVETPRTESMSDEHDRKLELELQSRSPQPIKLISATEGVAVFQVQRSDNGAAMYRVHFHHCPKRGFMLGQPERVVPQMVYAPVKPPGVQVKPQIDPANRYEQNPQDTVMPRIMRIVQKLDSDDSAKGEDQLVISCKLEDAFATKSLLDPIIDYHGAIAEVTEEGIIIKSGATPDFVEAVETATKALGRRLGRGLSRGGGGGSGKVRRAGRALTTRFNPDARDADLDMLVQEGTPWERPALPRKPGPSRGFRSSRRLLQGRNWDEEGDETDLDTPTPDARPEGVGAEERPPTKERMGQFTRDEYEAFRNEQIQKIIKAYGIQDVSDPLYPHPALTDFYNFDHTELVPIEFFDDMPGNIGPAASNGWDEDAATRAGEMRSYELEAPIIMGKLDELTEDIRANGIKHSLVVQYDPETGTLALDEGNHRLAAAQRLGMQVVPVRMIRQPSAKRRDIRGPKKEIPTRANSRGDLINANGELLEPSFKPSDIGVDTQSIAPETRRMRMLVAARGGSTAQGHRRRARRGLESTRNRFDFRATAVSPEREGGQRIERGSLRTPQLARDQTVVWNRATEAGLASRRAAELRGQGFNEAEVTSLMDPPPLRQSGLASRRNFHSENSYGNLRNLIDAREQMLNFLQENPHFDETLLNDYDPDTRSYPGIENFPGGHEEWDDLFSTWEELKSEYDDVLDFFREENDAYHAAEDRRNEVSGELEDHRGYLDSYIKEIEENFAPSHMPDGSYLDEDKILEFLKNNDYEGFRALFTPEYILERNDDRRNDRGGYFEDLAVDETRGKPGWETSLEYEWNSAIDVLKDIEEAEQNVYGAEMDVQQHAPNGADIVLEAAEKIDKFDRNMRIEVKPDDSLVSYSGLRVDDEYRRATGLALGDDLESHRIDATTGSLQDFKPKGTGFRSQRGAGLGEDFQLDASASTAINAAHYNAGDEELAVTFKGGRTYIYGGIASDIAAVVDAESSLGAAINEWVKGRESYMIKPDGTVVDHMGLPTELPTLGEKLKRHANRLRDHRGLDRAESETFKKAQKILDGTDTSPANPTDRSQLVKQLNSLADNIWRDEEPHVAGLLRDAAAAIRSDPGRRVNAHHSGRMEVSLSEGEIGEISDGLKSTRAKYDGHPDIELGLSAYDKKLQDSKGGKVSLDSAEYNQILESYARLEAVDPDGYFKPGRDVLEMAAFSKKGKWVSPNLAKDSQFPDRDHGFASRRPNNGAPADITPRLQGDLIYWARQQGGFHVVQDLVRRYDRGGEQLSPRDWIRLHDYYANYSPAGRGMPQYGERRGLRSSRGTPEKSPGGLKKPNEPTGMGPGQARFVGRKWDEVKPENWDELSIDEQVDELMINFNPRSDPNKPQVFDWPPPEERLRSVDYDRILGGLLEEIQTREERANPALAMSRRRRERRQRLADAAKNKPAIQRRTRRPQEDTVLSSATGERNTDAFQPGIGGSQREQLLDPEGGQNIEDDVGRQSSSPDAQVALDRRLRIMDALDVNIGIKRNALATAAMDDRADESHVEFWDSLQDTLNGDEDLTFDMIERLGVQIDDYLEDQTARTLTADEDRSMTFAGRLREQVVTLREQYEDDRFIKRGDPFIEDVEDTARRWRGTEAGPEGDDGPDDPGGTARVSREDERFDPKPVERPPTGMGVSREEANAVRTGMEERRASYRRARALRGEGEDGPEPKEPPEDTEEIESLGEGFRSRRNMGGLEWEDRRKEREAREIAKESRRAARAMSRAKQKRSKREEKRQQQRAKRRAQVLGEIEERANETPEENLERRRAEPGVMGQMRPVRTPWGFSSRRALDEDERLDQGDRRPAGEIMREEFTEGPTGEPDFSAHSMVHIDLDALEDELQEARADYREILESNDTPISVEEQLEAGEEIESLHRTRPHELSDMSSDELERLQEALEAGVSGGKPMLSQSISRELEIRDQLDEAESWTREEIANNIGQWMTPGHFATDDWGERGTPKKHIFHMSVVALQTAFRLEEEGKLDGIKYLPGVGPYIEGVTNLSRGWPGERYTPDMSEVTSLLHQINEWEERIYKEIGDPPRLIRGSEEAAVAKIHNGRYLTEASLKRILADVSAPWSNPDTPPNWRQTEWGRLAHAELARRAARDFDLSIPHEQRGEFHRSLKARSQLAPESMNKEVRLKIAMNRLRKAEEDRDGARLGQQFGAGLVGIVSDRHYLDDIEGRPRSESPAPRFTPGKPLSEQDIESVLEGPLLRRPDEELHARAMETPEERAAGKLTAQEEADQRVDELIASVEAEMEAAETAFRGNRTEEVEERDNEPAVFEPRPGARRADAFMSRRATESDGFRSQRDMSKQRAARNTKDRSTFKQSSPFFKIVYDSLDGEIKRERDSVKRRALEKLKKSFEYFNSSSIRYGPKNPHQSPTGEVQIDNNVIPDIVDALFDVLDRLTKRSETTELERTKALIDYLEVVDQSSGRTHPEVESMTPIRIAALNKFLQKLLDNGMDDWR